eukprot:gene6257-12666_t
MIVLCNETKICIVLFSLAFFLYGNTIFAGFVWDDRAAIISNSDVHGKTTLLTLLGNDFWGQNIKLSDSHKSYRPITVLTFRMNHYFHGLQAHGYHFINIFIYALLSISYFNFALIWLGVRGAFISSVLFCVHPLHAEAVSSLVGRADSLSFLLGLMSCLSKEIGFTVFGMFVVLEICGQTATVIQQTKSQNKHLKTSHFIFWKNASLAALSVLRIRINGEHRLYKWTVLENHISLLPDVQDRILSYAQTHFWMFVKLVYPRYLCFDYGMSCLPIINSITDLRNILPVSLYVTLIVADSFFEYSVSDRNTASGETPPTSFRDLTDLWTWLSPSVDLLEAFIGHTFELLKNIYNTSRMKIIELFQELYIKIYKIFENKIDNDNGSGNGKKIKIKSALKTIKTVKTGNIDIDIDIDSSGTSNNNGVPSNKKLNSNSTRFKSKSSADKVMWMVFSPVIVLLSILVIQRNYDWYDEVTLYRSALSVCADSAKALSNYGMLTMNRDPEGALKVLG